jgi:hypothetical protein
MAASHAAAQTRQLTSADLAASFHGNTAFFEPGSVKDSGMVAIFYEANGKVTGKLPDGKLRKGNRTIKDNTACITWEGDKAPICTKATLIEDNRIQIIGADGKPQGTISQFMDGDNL